MSADSLLPPPVAAAARPGTLPLCVDLDGTLIRSDMLEEGIAAAAGDPRLLAAMLRLAGGRAAFKQRIREATRRKSGRSMQAVVNGLRPYLLGWKAYFSLSQTPILWRELGAWLRHRLRALQLKHWRSGRTMYRELRALGASHKTAILIAANSRRWWHNSGALLNYVLTLNWFDRLGLPRLA